MEIYKTHIERSLVNAEACVSKISDEIKNMEGMTGLYTRHFYNNLLNLDDARYLEIGPWKGSSVCSAMYGNKATVVCIDNWCQFGGPKSEFIANFEKFKGDNNASFIEQDSFSVDIASLPKFNIYMYDGDHEHISHYKALKYYLDCLDDIFIYVVDDWNANPVRGGTIEAIKDLNIKVLYEKEIRMTDDGSHSPQPLAKDTWWNGMYVAVLQKN